MKKIKNRFPERVAERKRDYLKREKNKILEREI